MPNYSKVLFSHKNNGNVNALAPHLSPSALLCSFIVSCMGNEYGKNNTLAAPEKLSSQ